MQNAKDENLESRIPKYIKNANFQEFIFNTILENIV